LACSRAPFPRKLPNGTSILTAGTDTIGADVLQCVVLQAITDFLGDAGFASQSNLFGSHQLQPLEARMAVLADDDVVVDGDAERLGDVGDGAGHLHVGGGGRWITRWVVVDHAQSRPVLLRHGKPFSITVKHGRATNYRSPVVPL
jgi:hypothetical protein